MEKIAKEKSTREKNQEANFKVQSLQRPDNHLKYYQGNAYLFIQFGFSLLLTALKQEKILLSEETHLSMLEPMVEILGNALYSKHVSVITIVLRIFCVLIKSALPSMHKKETMTVITKRLLELVANSTSTSTELVQTAFKLLAIVIRNCEFIDVSEKQLVILLTLIKPDLEEPDLQNNSFNLIKAILSRKYVVNVIYEIMDDVSKILVTSQSHQVRQLCRNTFMQFLLDYPQGKQRLENQFNFIIKNLQYEFESGRESVLYLLKMIFDKFPLEFLLEYSSIILLALIVNLVNDESGKCRKLAGLLIKTLFEKIGYERTEKMLIIVEKWFEKSNEPQMVRTAAQVFGIVVDTHGIQMKKHLPTLLNLISKSLNYVYIDFKNSSSSEFQYWEAGYFCILLLSKLCELYCSEIIKKTDLLKLIIDLLAHPHQWIQITLNRLLSQIFEKIDHTTLSLKTESIKLPIEITDELYVIGVTLSCQLNSESLTEDFSKFVVKNLFFIGKCLYSASKKENIKVELQDDFEAIDDTPTKGNSSLQLLSIINKMSYNVRNGRGSEMVCF